MTRRIPDYQHGEHWRMYSSESGVERSVRKKKGKKKASLPEREFRSLTVQRICHFCVQRGCKWTSGVFRDNLVGQKNDIIVEHLRETN